MTSVAYRAPHQVHCSSVAESVIWSTWEPLAVSGQHQGVSGSDGTASLVAYRRSAGDPCFWMQASQVCPFYLLLSPVALQGHFSPQAGQLWPEPLTNTSVTVDTSLCVRASIWCPVLCFSHKHSCDAVTLVCRERITSLSFFTGNLVYNFIPKHVGPTIALSQEHMHKRYLR